MIALGEVVHYERDFPLDLVRPDTVGTKKPVKVGITLMVRHVDCKASRDVTSARRASAILGEEQDLDESDMYAACITGWKGEFSIEKDGPAVEYSPENARELLANPRTSWVFAQVRNATLRIENFMDA